MRWPIGQYHGFSFDGGGRCVDIPAHPGMAISAKLRLSPISVHEAYGRRFGELADRFHSGSLSASLGRAERQLLEDMVSLLVEQLERLAPDDVDAPVLARLRRLDPAMPDRICLDNLVFMHRIATANVSSLLLWLVYYRAAEAVVVRRRSTLPSSITPGSSCRRRNRRTTSQLPAWHGRPNRPPCLPSGGTR